MIGECTLLAMRELIVRAMRRKGGGQGRSSGKVDPHPRDLLMNGGTIHIQDVAMTNGGTAL